MIEYYAQIKWLHITAVVISGGLFVLRGLLVHNNLQRVARSAPARFLSYTVDSVLLVAALILVSMLPASVFSNGWLGAKITLLVGYIILGYFALHSQASRQLRTGLLIAAVLCYSFIFMIARAHHPLGIFVR